MKDYFQKCIFLLSISEHGSGPVILKIKSSCQENFRPKNGISAPKVAFFTMHYNKNGDVSSMPHASFYIFDELIGVNGEVLTMATSRVGLYPDKRNGPGCVTEDGKKNKIVWGVCSTPNGDASYWNDLIANNEGFIHVTRLP